MSQNIQTAVVSCAVLEPEVRAFTKDLSQVVDLVFLPTGLHETPAILRRELQQAITRAEAMPGVEAIVLVYGLCGGGVESLRHQRCPLIITRAHDCVTLFLGDKDKYADYQKEHPANYWYNPGWIRAHSSPGPGREAHLRREYAEKYDEEEIDFLIGTDKAALAHYDRATYVGLGLGEAEKEADYTKACAACMGWGFNRIPGDPALLRALLAGDWDERRFLIVPPRHVIRLTGDESIMRAEPERLLHEHRITD
ncbi:MAG: DUF1638 domain-containing protein [Opitutaceae bacterium]|nr:DUF1638 domain-containing protein [Opitutaceae bacterium]